MDLRAFRVRLQLGPSPFEAHPAEGGRASTSG
jgi:hypothetical protein